MVRAEGVRVHRVGVAGKFFVALGLVMPALVAVALIGLLGLSRMRGNIDSIHRHQVQMVQQLSDLRSALDAARTAALERISQEKTLTDDSGDDRFLTIGRLIEGDLSRLSQLAGDEPDELAILEAIQQRWEGFELARGLGRFEPTPGVKVPHRHREVVDQMLDPAIGDTDELLNVGFEEVAQARNDSLAVFTRSRLLMVAALLTSVILVIAATAWLIRAFVPRIRDYSSFADDVASGDTTRRIHPAGNDELSDLGRTLNRMVERRELERERERQQSEFTETLQVTETEEEAHEMLRRHLERSLDGASVSVLTRNNSADRLDAAATITDSEVLERLEGAQPRSCLAVRLGRVHEEDPNQSPLARCEICCSDRQRATCTPLLVGGEVIGSVLVQHERSIEGDAQSTLRESVAQAAPVVGNLRNLAIAELRAATDALTGLPNKRAAHATLSRLVALATRTQSPLTAMLLDLDHFKKINDTYGHGAGDEALAAAASAITSAIRESDFAARYGGEEFLILLPSTDADGARITGEKIRRSVETTMIAAVPQGITASIGIAVMPEDATTGDALVRRADRALYAAKAAGRNRIAMVEADTPPVSASHSETPDTSPADPVSATSGRDSERTADVPQGGER